jgi:hypothetical protein
MFWYVGMPRRIFGYETKRGIKSVTGDEIGLFA